MTKIVLLSTFPLPYHKIGSWTSMYDYYLKQENHLIDFIVCPPIDNKLNHYKKVSYHFVSEIKYNRLTRFYFKYRYLRYLESVESILEKETDAAIKIIDNVTLLFELDDFLKKKNLRNKCKLIFFMHGFSYFFDNLKGCRFYETMDHSVLLTNTSYKFELNRYSYISSKVDVLYNGVDESIFYPVTIDEKNTLKEKYGYNSKKVYLWISQDRPKKGLHVFLSAWFESGMNLMNDSVLLIIGTDELKSIENIHFLGKIPNKELGAYYQLSDFYFFTTLCHEGFPLSLTEAIMSGCLVFASDIEPVNEVIKDGKLGYLVKNPHSVASWIDVLNDTKCNRVLKKANPTISLPFKLSIWSENLSRLLQSYKQI